MRAIIPVAGVGERLRPFTQTIPKPLLPVAGKPILAHIMDELIDIGIEEFVLVVGHLSRQVREFITDRYKSEVKVDFVFQEKLLGLGYAVMLALDKIGQDEPVLIILGDTIVRTDLRRIVSGKKNALGLKEVEDPRRFGVAEIEGDRIISVVEKPDKPKTNWAVTGVYFINDTKQLNINLCNLWDNRNFTRGELQLTDALAKMIDDGLSFSWVKITDWFDCGTTEALLETNRLLLDTTQNDVMAEGCLVVPPVSIDPTADVKNSVIGPYVSIGPSAKINRCIISDSIIGSESSVCTAILKETVIGNAAFYQGAPGQVTLGDWSIVKEKSE